MTRSLQVVAIFIVKKIWKWLSGSKVEVKYHQNLEFTTTHIHTKLRQFLILSFFSVSTRTDTQTDRQTDATRNSIRSAQYIIAAAVM